MRTRSRAAAHPGERTWLDAHRADYLERRAEDSVLPPLIRAAVARHWIPGFITTAPTGDPEPLYYRSEAGDLLVSVQNDGTRP